jgi:hypothetical protein
MPAIDTLPRQLHKAHVRTPADEAYHRVTAALPPAERPRNEQERDLVRRVVRIMMGE